MPFDYSPPPKLWKPNRPAIIRASELPRSYAEAKKIALDGKSVAHLPGMAALWGGKSGPEPKAFSYLSRHELTGTGENFTFNVNVGAASPTLRLILGFSGGPDNRTFSSGTADGVNMAVLTDGSNNAQFTQSSSSTAGLLIVHLPSSSGTISISFNWSGTQGNNRTCFAAWKYTGGASNTALDVDSQNADNNQLTLTSVADGFVVGYGHNNSSSSVTMLGGLTQDNFSANAQSGTQHHGGGWGPTAGSTVNAGMDWAGSNTVRPQVYATF